MDLMSIRDTIIKPKLIEGFGATVANLIMTLAIGQTGKGKNDVEKLHIMVEFICSNSKIVALWGTAESKRQMEDWKKLLK